MKKLIRNGNDFLLGLVMLSISTFLVVSPYIVKGGVISGVGGGFFARADVYIKMLASFLLLLSIILIIKSINFKRSEHVKPLNIRITKEAALSAVALVLYVFLLPVVGFVITSFALIFFLVLLYMNKESKDEAASGDKKQLIRRIIIAAIYSAVLVAILYIIFTQLLGSVLP